MNQQKKRHRRHRWRLIRRAPNEFQCVYCGHVALENVRVPPCQPPSNKKTDTGDRGR